jgi:hypothetical protein
MTTLYEPSTITGTVSTWKRANRIEITNPAGGIPSAMFSEEIATLMPDGITIITQPSTTICDSATDMTVSFNLIDPSTGSTVGTMTYEQLYGAMYSLYLALAAARDAG